MALVKYHKPISGFFNTPSLFDPFYEHLKDSKKFEPETIISEHEEGYKIALALPGFKKEEVVIKLEQDQLIISSDLETRENKTEEETYYRKEITLNAFKRVFQLPKKANLKTIKAIHENGILLVEIAKQKETEYTKTIKIQ